MIFLMLIAVFAYWITPVVLIILGLIRRKAKPENAKKLFIVAAIMLLVGTGFCSMLVL